jgi:catechol 2,3-dioxygenase-like lactoylglutathione lyase family enzyme
VPGLHLHHVAFTVRDVEASGPWYQGVFEAQKVQEHSEPRPFHVFATSDGVVFGLVQHGDTPADDRFSETRVGLDHFAFGCSDRASLEALTRRLDGLGIPHSGIIASPAGHHINFRDPDNIALEFFAPAAG